MSTRAIQADDAVAAAALVEMIRGRPNDLIDPYPPAHEHEVLVDMGARGKSGDAAALVTVDEEDAVIAYGAVDFSPDMRRAQLIGPVVHPLHRRKGRGRQMLEALLEQARAARQKLARAAIGGQNGAARALLESTGFKLRERYTCFRMARPEQVPSFDVEGVALERVDADDAEAYFDYSRRLMPRVASVTRALLKNEDYVVIQALQAGRRVGCLEIDLRFDDAATIETIDAAPSLLHKGLGNALLAEAMRVAFDRPATRHLEFLAPGTDRERASAMSQLGFQARHEVHGWERRL